MAKSEFSETQFVFAYLRELFQTYSGTLWSPSGLPYFTLPSTIEEKDISADFLIRHYSHSEYYQFKRSDRLKYKLGPLERAAGVPDSYRTYYRFRIYNRQTTTASGVVKPGQFEKLRDLASNPVDQVYYCAPCFHTEEEFFRYFNRDKVVEHSIRINCAQFNGSSFQGPTFNVNEEHCIVYRRDHTYGYVCSEAQQINVDAGIPSLRKEGDSGNFVEYLLEKSIRIEKIGIFATRDSMAKDSILAQIGLVRDYYISTFNILWLPLFRYPVS